MAAKDVQEIWKTFPPEIQEQLKQEIGKVDPELLAIIDAPPQASVDTLSMPRPGDQNDPTWTPSETELRANPELITEDTPRMTPGIEQFAGALPLAVLGGGPGAAPLVGAVAAPLMTIKDKLLEWMRTSNTLDYSGRSRGAGGTIGADDVGELALSAAPIGARGAEKLSKYLAGKGSNFVSSIGTESNVARKASETTKLQEQFSDFADDTNALYGQELRGASPDVVTAVSKRTAVSMAKTLNKKQLETIAGKQLRTAPVTQMLEESVDDAGAVVPSKMLEAYRANKSMVEDMPQELRKPFKEMMAQAGKLHKFKDAPLKDSLRDWIDDSLALTDGGNRSGLRDLLGRSLGIAGAGAAKALFTNPVSMKSYTLLMRYAASPPSALTTAKAQAIEGALIDIMKTTSREQFDKGDLEGALKSSKYLPNRYNSRL